MPQRNKEYDFLVVGSGLFGAVFAYEMTKKGYKCLVIERRPHLGGNVYCEDQDGINVHKYGPHIFHTSDKRIWDYVNQFVEFNNYIHSPIAIKDGRIYNLPFNMNTFYQIWGIKDPAEAIARIESQRKEANIENPRNLEEQAISLIGRDVYELLVKGYTEKQWGKSPTELPPFLIKRLPVRFTFDNNYYNDKYQGIPMGGYNKIIEKLLENIPCKVKVDFLSSRQEWEEKADKIVYTGPIDQFYDYKLGTLEYRTVNFVNERLDIPNFQGNSQVNYTGPEVPFTRIIEHKHFEFGKQPITIITKEYSSEWEKGAEPFYPVNDDKNNKLFKEYQDLARNSPRVIFGGRLGSYKYYDMHQIIAASLSVVSKISGNA